MTTTVPFKAGDTFDFVGELAYEALSASTNWSARAWIRDLDSSARPPTKIDALEVTMTAPVVSGDGWIIRLYRAASATDSWPRPADNRKTRKLLCDIEFYDDSVTPNVVSSASFIIAIEFDPTRAA